MAAHGFIVLALAANHVVAVDFRWSQTQADEVARAHANAGRAAIVLAADWFPPIKKEYDHSRGFHRHRSQ